MKWKPFLVEIFRRRNVSVFKETNFFTKQIRLNFEKTDPGIEEKNYKIEDCFLSTYVGRLV